MALLYFVLVAGTATAEWASERHKIGQGTYTDTFEPLGIARAATWPVGHVVTDGWPGYPSVFDASAYRAVLGTAYRQTLGAALLEACLFAVLVVGIGLLLRRRR